MVGCLQQAMTVELDYTFSHDIDGSPPPSDVTIGEGDSRESKISTIGDGTVAYRVTIPITAAGTDVNFYADFVLIAKGRAGISSTSKHRITFPRSKPRNSSRPTSPAGFADV